MAKRFTLSILLAFFLLGLKTPRAQEKSFITIKSGEVNNRVVILDVVKAGKAYELQCNQGTRGCASLKGGKYQMVELPKNYGVYDCQNVEVYPESATILDENQKLGEYCLVEK